jgi:metallo-beta-lactamase class B
MFARSGALCILLFAGACASPPPQAGPVVHSDYSQWTEACADWDDWDKAGPPFRMHGNTYYVGTCGITALLVTGEDGHVLIDGGTAAGAAPIAANIEALGFRLADVKILLHSHEHFDHVGGLAELQRLTGARLLASDRAAPVIASGREAADDPQFGMHDPFPAARVDGLVEPGEPVRLGALALTAVATPGHTPGALSWQWRSCDGPACATVVYADSLSPISSDTYRFSDHPDHLAAFRHGLAHLASLDCEILLTPHPSASEMRTRLQAGSLFAEPRCATYARSIGQRLDARITEEGGQP